MTSGNEVPLRVAQGYSNLNIDHRLVKCIVEAIGDNKIDVATFDPLVTLHGVPENDTGKMDTVVRIFAKMADTQNCAIELSHHTRKLLPGSTEDYSVDDMRGAGSLKDAMRAVRMLNFMSRRRGHRYRGAGAHLILPGRSGKGQQLPSAELGPASKVHHLGPAEFRRSGRHRPLGVPQPGRTTLAREGRSRTQGRTRLHEVARSLHLGRPNRQRPCRSGQCPKRVRQGAGGQ